MRNAHAQLLSMSHHTSTMTTTQLQLSSTETSNEMTVALAAIFRSPSIWDTTRAIQRVGEALFTAMFVIAFLQAAVALIQYRTNPAGELIAPPGPTVGKEFPGKSTSKVSDTELEFNEKFKSGFAAFQAKLDKAAKFAETSTRTSRYARLVGRFNRFMFLLIPWASQQVSFLLQSQMHLLHIGFIFGIARLFDIPASFIEKRRIDKRRENFLASRRQGQPLEMRSKSRIKRILVIGDSLAVGLGTVNVFDKDKNQTVDYSLIENVSASPGLPGPAFPRVLATDLAEFQQEPVQWRSCGVDGYGLLFVFV
jgi:hypothetical protein